MAEFLQLFVGGIMVGALYALLGLAIVLVFKATRIVSLAHGELLAFGAFFLWFFLVQLKLPLWLAFALVIITSFIMGWLVERLTLRPLIGQPLTAAFLMTVAVYAAMDGVFQLWLKGETKVYPPIFPQVPIELGPLYIPPVQWVSFIVALVSVVLLALFFKYTRTGLAMRVTAEDHTVAQNLGVRVKMIFSLVWMISAVVAAISGVLLASLLDVSFQLPLVAFKGLVVAMFGGLDSFLGAILGGLILGVFESLSSGYLDPYVGGGSREVAAFVLLLLILMIRPYGLFGLKRIERL